MKHFSRGTGYFLAPPTLKLRNPAKKTFLFHFHLKFKVSCVAELNLILCIIILRYEQEAEKDRARYNTEKKEYLNKQSVC
jgi:hypothetical protein